MNERSEVSPASKTSDVHRLVMRVRIKIGAPIFHDYFVGKWPQCKPPKSEGSTLRVTEFPDKIFDAEWKSGRYWDCRADGYGYMQSKGDAGEYGNGSIFVHDYDGVEFIDA